MGFKHLSGYNDLHSRPSIEINIIRELLITKERETMAKIDKLHIKASAVVRKVAAKDV